MAAVRLRLGDKRLMWELILVFSLILGGLILALSLPVYNRVYQQFTDEIDSSGHNTVDLAAANVDSFFSDFDTAFFPVTADYNYIVNAIKNERNSTDNQSYVRKYLFSLFGVRKDLYGVGMYIPSSDKCYAFIKNDEMVHTYIYYDDSIKEDDWYKALSQSRSGVYIQPLSQTKAPSYRLKVRENFPIFHRSLPDVEGDGTVAVISLYLDSSAFEKIADSVGVGRGRACALTDRTGRVYYASAGWPGTAISGGVLRQALVYGKVSDTLVATAPEGNYRCYSAFASQSGLALVLCVPQREVDILTGGLRQYLHIIVPLLLLTGVALIALVSTHTTRPIERLARHMDKFGKGAMDERAEETGHNEITQLSRQFNVMVADIKRLLEESVQLRLAEKNALIKALEAEMDPHFLYNTLQAIATLALEHHDPEIYRALLALSATYRFSLTDSSVVSLLHELEHVRNYTSIQKLRLRERFQINYEIDDTVLERGIPKLAVQMLVENAIKHSMPQKPGVLTVDVCARREDDYLVLSVSDNGAGMTAKRLEQVRQSFTDSFTQDGAIGLPNLYKRLKLLYGENARLSLSTGGDGTTVTLRIPSLTQKEDVQP